MCNMRDSSTDDIIKTLYTPDAPGASRLWNYLDL